ncbi:hypothetical protein [Marinisporobacter balticus]|uniref:Uncharacterized protein n=1 Tax=Marinisporobacter balticus TaxID=2018667 RepID=A0A4R2L5V3_9FIRM|nr:hypothetical protein [Marinisporobacter balticus]TCO78018.1 hypothetical protein EV214_105117 [Marinisporobacter balticus]
MDIFISINNREQVIKLPVLPKEFKIQSGMKNETFDTIGQGEIKLIGMESLKSIVIQSFFPNNDYPFLRDRSYRGWQYVEMIEAWKDRRVPIRLIITDSPEELVNMACTIESFEYGKQDGTGDIYYTLTLSEFKFIKLAQKEV